MVLEGLRGEETIADLCRREAINQKHYCRWSNDLLEAGKKRLAGDTVGEVSSDEVKELGSEARQLNERHHKIVRKFRASNELWHHC